MVNKSSKKSKKRKYSTRFEKNKKKYYQSKTTTTNKKLFILLLLISIIFNINLLVNNISLKTSIKTLEKNHKKEVETLKNEYTNYLFLGDSITYFYDLENYFPNMPVVNSGIISNTTDDILDDMENRVYRYNPSKVFILIGTNDLRDKKSPDEIFSNIKNIIIKIKENRPAAKIYIESIYPVNPNIDEDSVEGRKNSDILKVNKELKNYSKKINITYIDVHTELVGKDGNLKEDYSKDGLHLNNKGYDVVTEELMKYLK